MDSLTQLIRQVGTGDRQARDALFDAAYTELRQLARSRLRDGGRHTMLDTAALVHESYLRFLHSGARREPARLFRLGLADHALGDHRHREAAPVRPP